MFLFSGGYTVECGPVSTGGSRMVIVGRGLEEGMLLYVVFGADRIGKISDSGAYLEEKRGGRG